MNIFKQIKNMVVDNKQLLLGGIASSLIYYGNSMASAEPWYPKELNQQLDPHLPTNGELLTGLVPPAALYGLVKFGKKQKLSKIADGSILFGVPNILARTIVQTAYVEGKPKTSLTRFNNAFVASKYIPNNSASRPAAYSSGSKYVLTS